MVAPSGKKSSTRPGGGPLKGKDRHPTRPEPGLVGPGLQAQVGRGASGGGRDPGATGAVRRGASCPLLALRTRGNIADLNRPRFATLAGFPVDVLGATTNTYLE